MKKKSEVIEKYKEYKSLVEKKTEQKIKTVRSDNGTEYTSHYLKDFLKQEGCSRSKCHYSFWPG
jgi:hypothetical protein